MEPELLPCLETGSSCLQAGKARKRCIRVAKICPAAPATLGRQVSGRLVLYAARPPQARSVRSDATEENTTETLRVFCYIRILPYLKGKVGLESSIICC